MSRSRSEWSEVDEEKAKQLKVVIACRVMEPGLERVRMGDPCVQMRYIDQGLHRTPQKMAAVETRLGAISRHPHLFAFNAFDEIIVFSRRISGLPRQVRFAPLRSRDGAIGRTHCQASRILYRFHTIFLIHRLSAPLLLISKREPESRPGRARTEEHFFPSICRTRRGRPC